VKQEPPTQNQSQFLEVKYHDKCFLLRQYFSFNTRESSVMGVCGNAKREISSHREGRLVSES
jgi:hypothetical protein